MSEVCPKCKKEEIDPKLALKCCFCSKSYHHSCVGVAQSYVIGVTKTNWVCPSCLIEVPKKVNSYNSLAIKYNELRAENDGLKQSIKDLENGSTRTNENQDLLKNCIDKLAEKVERIESSTCSTSKSVPAPRQEYEKMVEEYHDRISRSNNIIIKRLDEPQSNQTAKDDDRETNQC